MPQGKIIGPTVLPSKVYPNTTRNYWVYVPAQYDASRAGMPHDLSATATPTSGLKGSYRIPYVFDNLIYRREMPVTIGVFINPGHRPRPAGSLRCQLGRSAPPTAASEYNALNDKYSRLIVDELLPVLKKDYNISNNPEDRAISGASSGAICAFTVAWHRPDQFRKVISTIGSFTNIMGGHVYPDLIRKSERKPIRIFLQDGLNDNRGIRRDGSVRSQVGLARAEHQDGRGTDGEELRRELLPGASAPTRTSRAAPSCPRCSAGSGVITRGRMIRKTPAIGHCSFRFPKPQFRDQHERPGFPTANDHVERPLGRAC